MVREDLTTPSFLLATIDAVAIVGTTVYLKQSIDAVASDVSVGKDKSDALSVEIQKLKAAISKMSQFIDNNQKSIASLKKENKKLTAIIKKSGAGAVTQSSSSDESSESEKSSSEEEDKKKKKKKRKTRRKRKDDEDDEMSSFRR